MTVCKIPNCPLRKDFSKLQIEVAFLRQRAIYDQVTKVHTAWYLKDQLQEQFAVAKRYGRGLSLLLIDIDNFKKFNSEKGVLYGDKVLENIGKVLNKIIRQSDTVGRWGGGDEFCIILPETNANSALIFAKRVCQEIEQKTEVTFSIGVAEFKSEMKSTCDLVHAANIALNHTKSHGKNSASLHEDHIYSKIKP